MLSTLATVETQCDATTLTTRPGPCRSAVIPEPKRDTLPVLFKARRRSPLFATTSVSTNHVSGGVALVSLATRAHPHITRADSLRTVPRSSPLAIAPLRTIVPARTSTVLALAVSPNGGPFKFTSKDRHIGVWDAKSEERLHLLEGHRHYVHTVAFSPDELSLATGSRDEHIVIHSQSGPIIDTTFSLDGVTPVSVSTDMSIRPGELQDRRSRCTTRQLRRSGVQHDLGSAWHPAIFSRYDYCHLGPSWRRTSFHRGLTRRCRHLRRSGGRLSRSLVRLNDGTVC
jgi:WD40 repeat protein